MRILIRMFRELRAMSLGRELREALDRHDEAAAKLDAAVKEVLER